MNEEQERELIKSNLDEADTLFRMKRFHEANKCYDKILEISPHNREALFRKAICSQKKEDYEEAVKCFDRILGMDRYSSRIYAKKGNALYHLRRYEEATECYDKALEYLDTYYHADYFLYRKGMALEKLGKSEEAINCYNNVKLPSSAIGYSLSEDGEYEEAVKCFDKALEKLDSTVSYYSDVLRYKSEALENLGKHEEAQKCSKLQDTIPYDPLLKIRNILHDIFYYNPYYDPLTFTHLPFDIEVDLIKGKVTPDMQGDDVEEFYIGIAESFREALKNEGIPVQEVEEALIKIPSNGNKHYVIKAYGRTWSE